MPCFTKHGMTSLKTTHSKKDELAPSWPPPDLLHLLVKRASGHVLYASTLIKHLLHSREHPAKQLESFLENPPLRNSHPFSELDGLYSHILSNSSDVQRVFFLLHHKIYGDFSSIHHFESLMYLDVGSVQRILRDQGGCDLRQRRNNTTPLRRLSLGPLSLWIAIYGSRRYTSTFRPFMV